MFVELNSEAQIKYSFVSDQEIPQEAANFCKRSFCRTIFL